MLHIQFDRLEKQTAVCDGAIRLCEEVTEWYYGSGLRSYRRGSESLTADRLKTCVIRRLQAGFVHCSAL